MGRAVGRDVGLGEGSRVGVGEGGIEGETVGPIEGPWQVPQVESGERHKLMNVLTSGNQKASGTRFKKI